MARRNGSNHYVTRAELLAYMEKSDKRFEAMDQRFEAVMRELKAQREELKAQRHWTEVVVGGFQRRAGRNLEEMVAGCLRVALDMEGIRKEDLKLRQRLVDHAGEIGPKGIEYEVDLYASDGRSFVFEIKSLAEKEDVERFFYKAEWAAKRFGLKSLRKVFVTLEKSGEIQETCTRLGIELA